MIAKLPLRLPAALLLLTGLAYAQDAPDKKDDQDPAKPKAKAQAKPRRPPHRDTDGTYMGRPIAPVMSYDGGADWLVRPEREQEERPEEMLDALKIQPGWTVADVGAGVGYTSLKIARRVGPKGKVLATDLQPMMLRALEANARAARVKNVKTILATPTQSKLPSAAVDLVLMVDVYHECSDPEAVLKDLRRALKPGGKLVLVEFRAEDPDVPIKPEHKMTVAQVRKEIEPQGFAFKELHDFLPWQHIIVFEKKAEDPREKAKPAGDAPGGDTDKTPSRPEK